MLPSLERALQTLYTVNTRNDRREEDSQAVLREQTLSSSDLTPALSGVGQDSAAQLATMLTVWMRTFCGNAV